MVGMRNKRVPSSSLTSGAPGEASCAPRAACRGAQSFYAPRNVSPAPQSLLALPAPGAG
jgi:hypothetical protein